MRTNGKCTNSHAPKLVFGWGVDVAVFPVIAHGNRACSPHIFKIP